MTAVIRALKTELNRVEKNLAKVIAVMDANPLGRILEIRKEAQDILNTHRGDYARIAELIKPLAKEEREMFALSDKQITPDLIKQRVKLTQEKGLLKNKLWQEEKRWI